jgi:hypothetical protein
VIIGGAAVVVLGSRRQTQDVSFVTIPSQVKEARAALSRDPRFEVHPQTRHTYFSATNGERVQIDIVTPPTTFQARFDSATNVILAKGIRILDPVMILESKCSKSIAQRGDKKRETDASDIVFLLNYLVESGDRLSRCAVPSANAEFQNWFTDKYSPENKELFKMAGL